MTGQNTYAKPAAAAPEVRRQRPSNLVPILVVLFAILSALVLFVMDPSGSPGPQPNYRADAPPPPQSAPPR
ncbi:MAG TPA: hypothetical protein VFR00_03520 [Hyphomicrobiaceae bacterium]|nr:hypothetical protein [Hyphomicrobiaceae bacterium]